MKLLETDFTENKFCFHQTWRNHKYAVYRRGKENSEFFHFELIVIQSHNGLERFNNYYEPAEFYPSSAQWGTYGWSLSTEEKARQKMEQLEEKSKDRIEKSKNR